MTVSSIADDVNEDILFEFLAIVNSQPDHFINIFRFVTVHVNNWCLDRFSDIGAVETSPSLSRSCGKTDLVVGDNMNDTVDIIGLRV